MEITALRANYITGMVWEQEKDELWWFIGSFGVKGHELEPLKPIQFHDSQPFHWLATLNDPAI